MPSVTTADALHFAPPPHEMTDAAFVARFGGVYEHAPWVAEAILERGLGPQDAAVERLAARMAAVVDAAGAARQLALLRAHPELAGKLALKGALTAASTREQASAGLDACSPEEFAAFERLNAAYGARFGHPFIIAVRGLTRADILAAFERRSALTPEAEFATALAEVHKIARLRLRQIAEEARA